MFGTTAHLLLLTMPSYKESGEFSCVQKSILVALSAPGLTLSSLCLGSHSENALEAEASSYSETGKKQLLHKTSKHDGQGLTSNPGGSSCRRTPHRQIPDCQIIWEKRQAL